MIWSELEFVVVDSIKDEHCCSIGDECSNSRIALNVLSLRYNDDRITVEERSSLICLLMDCLESDDFTFIWSRDIDNTSESDCGCSETVDGMEILLVLLFGIGMGSTRSMWIFSFVGGDIGADNSTWSVWFLSFQNFFNDDFVSIVSFLPLRWWRLLVVVVSILVRLML